METINIKKYEGMGIFKEAKQRSIDGMGYRARRFKIVWQSKKVSWQHIMFDWEIWVDTSIKEILEKVTEENDNKNSTINSSKMQRRRTRQCKNLFTELRTSIERK